MSLVKTFDDRLDVASAAATAQVANGVANLFSYYGIALLAGFCFLMLLPVLLLLGFFAFLVPRILGIPLLSDRQHRASPTAPRCKSPLLK